MLSFLWDWVMSSQRFVLRFTFFFRLAFFICLRTSLDSFFVTNILFWAIFTRINETEMSFLFQCRFLLCFEREYFLNFWRYHPCTPSCWYRWLSESYTVRDLLDFLLFDLWTGNFWYLLFNFYLLLLIDNTR